MTDDPTTTGGMGSAADASVDVVEASAVEPQQLTVEEQLRAIRDYEVLEQNVANAEAKIAKFEGHLAGAKEALENAKQELANATKPEAPAPAPTPETPAETEGA